MEEKAVQFTDLKGMTLIMRGKVRDLYDLGEQLLIVTSDRISAFDHVLDPPIPNKGKVLTQLSAFWFEHVSPLMTHHMITTDIDEMPEEVRKHRDVLEGRSMLVRKSEVYPVECIVRGYLAGSAWTDYVKTGTVCGERMPIGLEESERLQDPLFTPSTKELDGHDENITFQAMTAIIGKDIALEIRTRSLELFKVASEHALKCGIILADTKFEWGIDGSQLLLVDEIFTPDSSRFWPKDQYKKGGSQPSFDKQFVRDHLVEVGWDKNSDPPRLPDDVVMKTSEKYIEAFRLLTGKELLTK